MDIVKKAKKIINENQDMFSALEEADRTGKLRKISYKERFTFTIDDDIMQRFRKKCNKECLKMSNVVERMIKSFLNQK